MIKCTVEKHMVTWLYRSAKKDKLNFGLSIQRKEVWNHEHKSNLVASVLLGVPLESFLFEEEESGDGYLVLDGQQRGKTLIRYIDGEFAISSKCKIKNINGEEIIGKKYSDLSEELQEKLNEYELSIAVTRPLTKSDRELLFFMRNQAVPLSKFDLTRSLMGEENLRIIKEVSEHPFWEKMGLVTKTAKNEQLCLELLILESSVDLGFSGRELMKFAELIKRDGIGVDMDLVKKTLDFMDNAIESKIRKVHIPAIYVVAKKALNKGITPDVFGELIKNFFSEIKEKDENNEYVKAQMSGIMQKSNVLTRINYLTNYYEKHIDSI